MNKRQSMVILILLAVVAVAGAWLWIRHTRRDVRYEVVYPPVLQTGDWSPWLLSDTGHIAGRCVVDSARGLFVLEPDADKPRIMGLEDKSDPNGGPWAPRDINADGAIVGIQWRKPAQRAFLWTPEEGVVEITPPGGGASLAYGINNSGCVVGTAAFADIGVHAFLWDRSSGMKDLGTLGGRRSEALAVNDAIEVVGRAETPEGEWRAFFWDEATGMVPLDTPGTSSTAYSINNTGQVLGAFWENGRSYGFLWTRLGGVTTLGPVDLGAAGSLVLNDRGQFFVNFWLRGMRWGGPKASRLWNPGEGYIRLDRAVPRGVGIPFALDINNRGQVLAVMYDKDFSELGIAVLKPLDQAVVEEKRKDQP